MAINRANLLEKLSFVQYGGGVENYGGVLRDSLTQYLRQSGSELISSQTIRYWFEKGSLPTRQPALEFIHDYFLSQVDYRSLTRDGKKVHSQIEAFLRGALSLKPINKMPYQISMATKSRLIIDTNSPELHKDDGFLNAITGVYRTFRIRFSEKTSCPIAAEVLRIFRRNKEIRFEHWYKRQGVDVTRFEGVIFTVENVLWMIGSAIDEHHRLRIMNFRNISSSNPRYNELRWGLMLGDIPIPSVRDPAACRIVLIRENKEIMNFTNFVKNNVKPIDFAEIPTKERDIVSRLIDNKKSALSVYGSLAPVQPSEPAEVVDSILKVNQATLDFACEALAE